MLVILENPKVAVSSSPLGTIAGVQFEAVYQSVLVALTFQVALLAKAVLAAKTRDAGRIVAMSVAPSRCSSARRLNLAGCFFMGFLSPRCPQPQDHGTPLRNLQRVGRFDVERSVVLACRVTNF